MRLSRVDSIKSCGVRHKSLTATKLQFPAAKSSYLSEKPLAATLGTSAEAPPSLLPGSLALPAIEREDLLRYVRILYI